MVADHTPGGASRFASSAFVSLALGVLVAGLTAGSVHAASFSLVGGKPLALGSNFNPPNWSNPDGVGQGSAMLVFDSQIAPGEGLILSDPATVSFTFLGSEATLADSAHLGEQTLFDNRTTPVGKATGGFGVEGGVLKFSYRAGHAVPADAVNGGPIHPYVSMAFVQVSPTRAYAFFDDSLGGDGDYDDMVVRIEIHPGETSELLPDPPDLRQLIEHVRLRR